MVPWLTRKPSSGLHSSGYPNDLYKNVSNHFRRSFSEEGPLSRRLVADPERFEDGKTNRVFGIKNLDRKHNGCFDQLSGSGTEAGRNPQNTDGTKEKPDSEYDREIENTPLYCLHSSFLQNADTDRKRV
jgi:hypothetical protein